MAWALRKGPGRQLWLDALCGVAEGAGLRPPPPSYMQPAAFVTAAVVSDPRVCAFHGREGLPRALGSVYACYVTLFLGGQLRGVRWRSYRVDGLKTHKSMAVTADGAALLLASANHCIVILNVADGRVRRTLGSPGHGPHQFWRLGQLSVASDGAVFVADSGNNRIQVLTPALEFARALTGAALRFPVGVCADAENVYVAHDGDDAISVLHRESGALRWLIRACAMPRFLCLLPGRRQLAVSGLYDLHVVGVYGEPVRYQYMDRHVTGIACSAAGELVLTAGNPGDVYILGLERGSAGEFEVRLGSKRSRHRGVALHGDVLYVNDMRTKCTVAYT